MKAFALMALINAFLLTPLIVLLHATAAVEFKEHGKAISRGGYDGVFSFANFKQDKFSYLNITVLEKRLVDQMPECSFACLKTPPCFSFNLNAFPDIANKLHCELLPADKYNNTDEFIFSNFSHHFSITTPCSSWPCKNNGTCLPLYEDNDYKCVCKRFTGRNCESDIDECASENECHTNATCTNTKGSYNCTCKGGFQGDGRNCNDTDECSSENDCHVNATCKKTKGSYNCICLEGFQGDGRNCTVVRLGDSVIIGGNQTYFDLLSNWLNPVAQSNGQWILCWRASLHGWAASTFHSLCNNKGPTVSLMRDTKYNVFGGYTSTSWSGSGTKNDLSAFLFSLKNPTDDPRKLPHRIGKSYSMRDYAGVGPSFGQGKDLFIANNADENSDSFENLGYTYTVPSGRLGDPFLTGAKHFTLNEVETFYETTP